MTHGLLLLTSLYEDSLDGGAAVLGVGTQLIQVDVTGVPRWEQRDFAQRMRGCHLTSVWGQHRGFQLAPASGLLGRCDLSKDFSWTLHGPSGEAKVWAEIVCFKETDLQAPFFNM